MQVNCFLDEGSDKTYVNEVVVEELGLEGRKEKVTIRVANDQKVDLMSATMEIYLNHCTFYLDRRELISISELFCPLLRMVCWFGARAVKCFSQTWNLYMSERQK